MKIYVFVKRVLDPDAVNNYALVGKLEIGADGRSLTQTAIPDLMNAYDEQALEVALRLRDAGTECTIHVVTVGADRTAILRHAASIGADEISEIVPEDPEVDVHTTAALLAAFVRQKGTPDLVLCGRQASDDDQGVVPALVAEALGLPLVNVAKAIEKHGDSYRVTRVTPDGDEIVAVEGAAVVTLSNEVGDPRYPTAAKKLKARRVSPEVVTASDLGVSGATRTKLVQQFVPDVEQNCEFIEGASPAEIADRLIERLREDRVLP
ncbi:MAG: electron transfer flavoprotein subunit beta/FixA family protein [Myxococcota bacterium]|jgi:electron transfer flavoprotein beta subunit